MSKRVKPEQAPPAPPVPPSRNRLRGAPAPNANPLVQPIARWQRFQRYVWDKRRG